MLKKTLITTIIILFTATFAAYGQLVVSPTVGFGMMKGPDIQDYYFYFDPGTYTPTYVYRINKGTWKTSYCVGLGFSYFFTNYTAFIIEPTLVGLHAPEYNMRVQDKEYFYLTLPVGIRQYINDNIFFGGGLYSTYIIGTEYHPMNNYGLFADIGTSFHLSNGNLLLLYGRYKFGRYHWRSDGYKWGTAASDDIKSGWRSVAFTLNIAYGFYY